MDMDDDTVDSYKQTAVHIIDTLQYAINSQGFLNPDNCVSLEKLIEMITTNLIFDDPGILFKCAVQNPEHRLMQEAFNMWLNNQITYVFFHATKDRFVFV